MCACRSTERAWAVNAGFKADIMLFDLSLFLYFLRKVAEVRPLKPDCQGNKMNARGKKENYSFFLLNLGQKKMLVISKNF